MNLAAPLAAAALAAAAALVPVLQDGGKEEPRKQFNSYLGKAPPEIAVPADGWFNSKPLSLKGLRGKVVWLESSFST